MENNANQNDFVSLQVGKDRIGIIIGAGGKTIKEIQAKTGTRVKIEDDGTVKVFGDSPEDTAKALNWIKVLSGEIRGGDRFTGTVRRIVDFGMFVELVPGVDGLVHISAIPRENQENIQSLYPVGSILPVEVMEYNPQNRRISLKLV